MTTLQVPIPNLAIPATAPSTPAPMLWTGRILSGLTVLFLLFDGGIKLVPIAPVTETMAQLGWPTNPELARGLGAMTLAIAAIYAFPRTALLGGAIATHLRVGGPVFSHLLFGLYLGLIAWGGLWLRDGRLRAVLPLRR